MKRIIFSLAIFMLFASGSYKANPMMHGSVNFGYFYYELSPYGEWIEIDADLIVWRPSRVNFRWSPYSVGRWIWTDYGWYWESYEPFGNITYHYGRWIYDDYYGWIWIPDYEWAPAWVEWRYDDLYIGWAPLPPYATFRIDIGIHFTVNWHPPYYHWHFVSYNRFGYDRVYNYFVADHRVRRFFNRTKLRTNYEYRNGRVVNRGIERRFVERRAGRSITTRNLQFSSQRNGNSAGSRSVLRVYVPGEKTLGKYRSIDRSNIKRAHKTSILRDKVAVTRPDFTKGRRSTREKYKDNSNVIRKNYSPDRVIKKKEKYRTNTKTYKRNDAINRKKSRESSEIRESILFKNEAVRKSKKKEEIKSKLKNEKGINKYFPRVGTPAKRKPIRVLKGTNSAGYQSKNDKRAYKKKSTIMESRKSSVSNSKRTTNRNKAANPQSRKVKRNSVRER